MQTEWHGNKERDMPTFPTSETVRLAHLCRRFITFNTEPEFDSVLSWNEGGTRSAYKHEFAVIASRFSRLSFTARIICSF